MITLGGCRHIPLMPALLIVWLFSSCSKTPAPDGSDPGAALPGAFAPAPSGSAAAGSFAGAGSVYGLEPLAILEPGDVPLWFELGSGGPRLIDAPGAAALTPFEPWPFALYITGFLLQGDTLFLAVNRDGFLFLSPRRTGEAGDVPEGLLLYRAADPAFWSRYTVASLFLYQDLPAVLLYRDDFFADPPAEAPSPRVRGLVPGSPRPEGLEIPAFETFPPEAGWDIDALRRGPDGLWYYRGVQNPPPSGIPSPRYLRTTDLSLPGEESSLAAFQESARPESPAGAPPLLRLVLEEAFKLSGPGPSQTAAVLFPGCSGPRRFSSGPNAGDRDLVELSGYYREAGTGTLPDAGLLPEAGLLSDAGLLSEALVIREDGRGIYGKDREDGLEVGAFFLPPLQEGFVYTGLAPAGSALVASWEEQQGWNVGAAGFMVIR